MGDDEELDEVFSLPPPADRGPPPDGVRLEARGGLGELLVASRDFEPGELVVREEFLLLSPPEFPPMGMFRNVPPEVSMVEVEGEGFPQISTFNNTHLKLLLEFVNADGGVQAEALRMQHEMAEGSECARSIEKAAAWLADSALPWLVGMDQATLVHLLKLFCVNAYPCKKAGSDVSGLLKWGTMINHSCRPNVFYRSVGVGGRFEGHYYALQAIREGDVLGSSYMNHCGLIGSLVQRRRVLWCLKGFACLCPRCSEEAAAGDPARALRCVSCPAGCLLRWCFRPGSGAFGFRGDRCGGAPGREEELRELQASAEMMFLLLNERQRESAALLEPLRQRLAELPECHWACQGLRLLDLSTEGRQLAGGGGAAPQAAQQERAAPWAQGALRADDWLREARGDGHGLMSFRLAPLVLELAAAGFADLLGGELLGRARAAAALERAIYGDDDGDNGGRGAG